jgi:hypothetical protein
LKPAQENFFLYIYSKKKKKYLKKKKAGGVAQGVGPEFRLQHSKKKKRNQTEHSRRVANQTHYTQ